MKINITNQLNKKLFFLFLLVILLAVVFYNFNDNKTANNKQISQSNHPQDSDIRTDSLENLKDEATSSLKWGDNPFGSGSPQTETPISNFQMPNTEWKTRTISGITYVFGEGNPEKFTLTKIQLQELREKCKESESDNNDGYLCKEQDGYITPEVEKYIIATLSDRNWENLLTKCQSNLRYYENQLKGSYGHYPNEGGFINFDIVANTDFLDINNWITIDSFGRKQLDVARVILLNNWISESTKTAWIDYYGTTTPTPWIDQECVDRYGVNIVTNLSAARESFISGASNKI